MPLFRITYSNLCVKVTGKLENEDYVRHCICNSLCAGHEELRRPKVYALSE